MATGTDIRTYFNGQWHEGDLPVMRAADHGSWLGSTVWHGMAAMRISIVHWATSADDIDRSAAAIIEAARQTP